MPPPSCTPCLSTASANSTPNSLAYLPATSTILHAGHGNLYLSTKVQTTANNFKDKGIFKTRGIKISATSLPNHTGVINTLTTIEGSSSFITGGTDGVVKVWSELDGADGGWTIVADIVPEGCHAVTNVSAVRFSPYSSSSDASLAVQSSSSPSSFPTNTPKTITLITITRTSSSGVLLYSQIDNGPFTLHSTTLVNTLIETVCLTYLKDTKTVVLAAGAASARFNRVFVCTISIPVSVTPPPSEATSVSAFVSPPLVSAGALLGHQDWVRCLDFSDSLDSDGSILLASGSHDHKVRLWMFNKAVVVKHTSTSTSTSNSTSNPNPNSDLEITETDNTDDDSPEEIDVDSLLLDSSRLTLSTNNNTQIPITLEALLIGHEASVSSVQWKPGSVKPTLLTSSMDRTLLIWQSSSSSSQSQSQSESLPKSTGNWSPIIRVGAAGGIIGGSLGSSLLGFVGGVWGANGDGVVGVGYGGGIQVWKGDDGSDGVSKNGSGSAGVRVGQYYTEGCVTGHFGGVVDCSWECSKGRYLLSSSEDQTCRMWSPVDCFADSEDEEEKEEIWIESGRPQIHGYNLTALVHIGNGNGNGPSTSADGDGTQTQTQTKHRFVSGADEKQLRVFDAPKATVRLLHNIQGSLVSNDSGSDSALNDTENDKDEEIARCEVERAYLPSLGLSNKGGEAGDGEQEGVEVDDGDDSNSNSTGLAQLSITDDNGSDADNDKYFSIPLERDLGVATLWPEVRKMYGHGSEILSLCSTAQSLKRSTSSKVIVASSCKSRDIETAGIRLWDVDAGVCVCVLDGGHRSSVTTLSFNCTGLKLASSGKDRRICVWEYDEGKDEWGLKAAVDGAHKRIVWAVSWAANDENMFASGGRDGALKVWKVGNAGSGAGAGAVCVNSIMFKESLTAVAFSPVDNVIAVGFESGKIEVRSSLRDDNAEGSTEKEEEIVVSEPLIEIKSRHTATVKRLCWRPGEWKDGLYLASCSEDRSVKVFKIVL